MLICTYCYLTIYGLSLPPQGSKLLHMFCPDISSAQLLVHPKQTYFAIKIHS